MVHASQITLTAHFRHD